MGGSRCKEREIDLLDLLGTLLEQWRVWLLIGFIFSLLVSSLLGLMYITPTSGISNGENLTETTDVELDKEYQPLLFALSLYVQCRFLENEYIINTNSGSGADLIELAQNYQDVRKAYDIAYTSLNEENQILLTNVFKMISKDDYKTGNIASAKEYLDKQWATKLSTIELREKNSAIPSFKDSFNKQNIIFGFIMGMFIYVIIVASRMVFSKKVVNVQDVESIFGVRHYGNIYRYPYRDGLAKLIHHKAVYNWRKKSSDSSEITEDLITKLDYSGENSLTMILLGHGTVIEEQVSALKSHGISVNTMEIFDDLLRYRDLDFIDISPVFIQVNSGKATFYNMIALKNKLDEYNVKIIGTELVEM